jgi:hypothetical protein
VVVAPGQAAVVADVAEDGLIAFQAMMEAIGGSVLVSQQTGVENAISQDGVRELYGANK